MTKNSLLCEGNSIKRLCYISRNHKCIETIFDRVGHPGRRVSTLLIGLWGLHSGRFKETTAQTNHSQRA